MRSSALVAIALVLAACLFAFAISCASGRKADDGKQRDAVEAHLNEKPEAADDKVMPSFGPDGGSGRNAGMIRFVGATPTEILTRALADKDADAIRGVVFNALKLDYVMPDGRTVRQAIIDTGDSECMKVISEAENIIEDPRILK